MIRINSILSILVASTVSQAALFSGSSFFSTVPNSQLGPVSSSLILTDTVTGFIVSGQVTVTVSPGFSTGTLVQWVVDRPLDATYGFGIESTTTVLDGFSAPPPGIALNTSGTVRSEFTNYPIVSQSLIPMNLVAGVDSPPWFSLSNTSGTFAYTSGGTNYLRQVFDLDGIYSSGPGGNWVIDVPVTTFVTTVPEMGSLVLTILGVSGGLFYGWRRHRHSAKL